MNTEKGVDVSVYQRDPDWNAVRADGISFAMIKASQGRSEYDDAVRLFEDAGFRKNIEEASAAGLRCGVYHYLTSRNTAEAEEEAEYFLSVTAPFRDRITLWAAADAESRFLPDNREELTAVVRRFLDVITDRGYRPMLYTNPYFLRNRFTDVSGYPLWLALWRDPELLPSAEQYPGLTLWQWGRKKVSGIDGLCDCDLALEPLPALPFAEAVDYAEEVRRFADLSEITKEYLLLYKYGKDLFQKLYDAILRGGFRR